MTRVKITGLAREEDIAAVNELLPDYVGFVFVPDDPRYLTPERALELKEGLDEDLTVVGVFANAPARFVAALLNEDLIDIAQLNGEEDAAFIESVRSTLRAPDEKAIVQAVTLCGADDVRRARESAADMVEVVLAPDSDASADWQLFQDLDRPCFLGGILDAATVDEAMSRTGAAYVSYDGDVNPAFMTAFMDAVRTWDEAHPRLSFLESLHPEYHEG